MRNARGGATAEVRHAYQHVGARVEGGEEGVHQRPDVGSADSDIVQEGEFQGDIDDRTPWMKSARQGKATIASCVSK